MVQKTEQNQTNEIPKMEHNQANKIPMTGPNQANEIPMMEQNKVSIMEKNSKLDGCSVDHVSSHAVLVSELLNNQNALAGGEPQNIGMLKLSFVSII